MRRTPVVTVVNVVVVLAILAAGLAAFVLADKAITLSVDGKEQTIRTYAKDVAGLLEEEGIDLASHDSVLPAPGASLNDGQLVAVRHGRLIEVVIDGERRRVWTTAQTIGEAAQEFDARAEGAYLSASRSQRIPRSGVEFEMRLPKTITVTVDGTTHTVVTTSATLADALAEAQLAVGPADEVSVALTERPSEGLALQIARVSGRQETLTVAVPFETRTQSDPALIVGTKKVVQAGKAGTATQVWQINTRDGAEIGRSLVSSAVTVPPVEQIVATGSKPRPVVAAGPIPSGALNWAALARCESSGNPRAVNPAGYYGLYQFSLSTWRAYGGTGNPIDHTAAEQTRVAQNLYNARGRQPWPHCGKYL